MVMMVVIMLPKESELQLEVPVVVALEPRQQIQPQVAPVMMVSLMVVMVFKTTLLELTSIGVAVAVVQLILMDMQAMADSAVAEEALHNLVEELVLEVRAG
jgi:hypothetical protein